MAVKIQVKRGLEENVPNLAEGEFAFTTDSKKVFIGDGASNHEMITSSSNEWVQDTVGAMVTGNNESGISVTYDDVNGKLNFSGSSINWLIKTSAYTLSNLDGILADTSGGAFSVTLPASPSLGDTVHFYDYKNTWTTNNLTILRNGSNIDETAEDLVCDTCQHIILTYTDATVGWQISSEMLAYNDNVVLEDDLIPYDSALTADDYATCVAVASSDSKLFRFNNHLNSTDGTVEPEPGYLVTMRPDEGKFGGAVAVEEATENEITDQTVFTLRNDAGATSVLETSGIWSGWYKATITRVGDSSLVAHLSNFSHPDTETHTYSIEWYCPTGNIRPFVTGTQGIDYLTFLQKYRYELTWKNTSGAAKTESLYLRDYLGRANTDVTETVYYRYYQVEQKSFSTSFVDGSRAAGALEYADVLGATAGTISFNLYIESIPATEKYLLNTNAEWNAAGNIRVTIRTVAAIVEIRDTAGASYVKSITISKIIEKTWQHWCIVYDQDAKRLDIYIDGELVTNGTATSWTTLDIDPDIHLGNYKDGSWHVNTLWDELYFSPVCLSADEIARFAFAKAPIIEALDPDIPSYSQVWFEGDGVETDFDVPVGYSVWGVYNDGLLVKEGVADQYTISESGSIKTVEFATAPANGNDICIMIYRGG